MSGAPITRQKRLAIQISNYEAAAYEAEAGTDNDTFGLLPHEASWVTYYNYLFDKGYQLRPRFRPGWVRSWKGTCMFPGDCEDAWARVSQLTLDAIRLSDGKQVAIKKILPPTRVLNEDNRHRYLDELKIVQYLSQPKLRSDSRNHTIPYHDSFPIPDVSGGIFMVTPLMVPWDKPPLVTVNQALDFMRQLLEGLAFLHRHGVAHRDCSSPSIMMDLQPLVEEPFHPIRNACSLDGEYQIHIRDRREAPVRYYFIDFDISTWFKTQVSHPRVKGREGYERNVPELNTYKRYNPFKVDIFIIGAFLERDLVEKFPGLMFLRPLVARMKSPRPRNRPRAEKAVRMFEKLVKKRPPRLLDSSLTPPPTWGILHSAIVALRGLIYQGLLTVGDILQRRSAN